MKRWKKPRPVIYRREPKKSIPSIEQYVIFPSVMLRGIFTRKKFIYGAAMFLYSVIYTNYFMRDAIFYDLIVF